MTFHRTEESGRSGRVCGRTKSKRNESYALFVCGCTNLLWTTFALITRGSTAQFLDEEEALLPPSSYRCNDYSSAIPIQFPDSFLDSMQDPFKANIDTTRDAPRRRHHRTRLLDFILADVVCKDYTKILRNTDHRKDVDENPLLIAVPSLEASTSSDNDTTAASTNTSTTTIAEDEIIINMTTKVPADVQSIMTMNVPQIIHYHLYAVSDDMELRYNCHPPQFAQPILGPLPTRSRLTAASMVFDQPDSDLGGKEMPSAYASSDSNNTLPPPPPALDLLHHGLSFVYNASVPVVDDTTTISATIELWIPIRFVETALLLGPSFDHKWNVDLTMMTSTTSTTLLDNPPPEQVRIYHGGVGTDLVVSTTSATNLQLWEQSLDSSFQVHIIDRPIQEQDDDDNAGDHYDLETNTGSQIVTLGSNVLGSIIRDKEEIIDNSTSTDEDYSFVQIILAGFQQKITTNGVMTGKNSSSKDEIHVTGLAIDLFTTANCDDVFGFHPEDFENGPFPNLPQGGINAAGIVVVVNDTATDWQETLTSHRERHINHCYHFEMDNLFSPEQSPGQLQSVFNRTAFFGNVKANGPTLSTQSSNSTNMPTSSITTAFGAMVPLGPFLNPLPCASNTQRIEIKCISGAATTRKPFGMSSMFLILGGGGGASSSFTAIAAASAAFLFLG